VPFFRSDGVNVPEVEFDSGPSVPALGISLILLF
jgi:hypothetical protein